MFERLLERAVIDVEVAHRERVASLAAALRRVRFALPADVDELRVRVLGLRPGPSPLPSRVDAPRGDLRGSHLAAQLGADDRPAQLREAVAAAVLPLVDQVPSDADQVAREPAGHAVAEALERHGESG
jgi:hypothetical protein